jgi:hypothetical protein
MKPFTKVTALLLTAAVAATLAGCPSDAQMASNNLSKAADNFEVMRRIVFFNGITDKYLLTIEGKCSITTDSAGQKLDVTCKTGVNEVKKHFLGLSDNVSYMVEQLEAVPVSLYHYRVIFKPQAILPDIDFKGSTDALLDLTQKRPSEVQ